MTISIRCAIKLLTIAGRLSLMEVIIKRYLSLPTQVEAVQFTDKNKDGIFNCLTGNYCADTEDGKPVLRITTVHGETAVVRLNNWIVKDAEPGTYYPMTDKIFKQRYTDTI